MKLCGVYALFRSVRGGGWHKVERGDGCSARLARARLGLPPHRLASVTTRPNPTLRVRQRATSSAAAVLSLFTPLAPCSPQRSPPPRVLFLLASLGRLAASLRRLGYFFTAAVQKTTIDSTAATCTLARRSAWLSHCCLSRARAPRPLWRVQTASGESSPAWCQGVPCQFDCHSDPLSRGRNLSLSRPRARPCQSILVTVHGMELVRAYHI